jgi:hypothetical protein
MIVASENLRTLAPVSLDDLAARTTGELETLYRAGTVPASFDALDGAPTGRMLTVKKLERGRLGRALGRLAASPSFVWGGKSFTSTSATSGTGINRIHLPGLLGDQALFPFRTSVAPSDVDGAPTIVLDYDLPENPPWIRRVHDELREVGPGLFLGPAMVKGREGKTTVLWFALDARLQA